jgi:parallel beta-helix repeat protein
MAQVLLLLLAAGHWQLGTAWAQQAQAQQGQPIYAVNAKYVQGVGPGYWPTAGAGLTLNIAAGTAICGNLPVKVDYAGGTLTMTNAATNYVYLDPVASCVPAKNTTGFTAGVIPVAQVAAAGGVITGVTDVRTWFVDPNSYGPVCRADLMPGADAGAKIAACWAVMPTGGTTDARGLLGAQSIPSTVVLNKPGTLLLPDGPFTLPTGSDAIAATGFDVEADNVHIIGTGATVLQATRDWANGTFYGIGVFGFTGFVAEGLDIRITTIGAMPGVTYAIAGVCVRGLRTTYDPPSTNFRIANNRVWVRGAVTDEVHAKIESIWIFGGGPALRAKGGVIENNLLDDSHGRGIYLYNAENVTIANNVVRNLGSTLVAGGAARGIRVIGSRAVSVVGNTIISGGSAGYLRGITVEGDSANSDITITGNVVHFDGTILDCDGAWVENANYVNFTGNTLAYTGANAGTFDGVQVYTNAGVLPVTNLNINSNTIYGWTGYQVRIIDAGTTDALIGFNMLGKSVGAANNYYWIHPGAVRVNYASNVEGDSAGVYFRQAAPSFATGLLAGTATAAMNRTFRVINSYTSPGTGPILADAALYLNEVTAPIAIGAITNAKTLGILSTNTQNWTSGLAVDQSSFVAVAGATGTFAAVTAYQSAPALDAATATNFYGFRAKANVGAGTITNKWSFKGETGAGIAEIADGIKTAKFIISGVNTVTFSATPTFDASLGNTQKITLTGNVTSSTLSNATTGQTINFLICQDATGGRTFVWPTNVKGGMTIGSTLSTCSAQNFIFDGTNAYAVSSGVTNM